MEKSGMVNLALANLLDEGRKLDPKDTGATTMWAAAVSTNTVYWIWVLLL